MYCVAFLHGVHLSFPLAKDADVAKWSMALDWRLMVIQARYEHFDAGHNQAHVRAVVDRACVLARKYAPEQELLAVIAATYHDVGLANGREDHEVTGAQAVMNDPVLQAELTADELRDVAHAVREHRASTGNPRTVLAKIVADADSTPINTAHAYMRALAHGCLHHPELDADGQLRRAARFLQEKYGPEGYGRVTHFPETEKVIQEIMEPIFTAHDKDDLDTMRAWAAKEGFNEVL